MDAVGRGDRVVVRAFGDKPLVRQVWMHDGQNVWINTDGEFAKASKGQAAQEPVAFPVGDVFEYRPDLEEVLKQPNWWERLEVWRPKPHSA